MAHASEAKNEKKQTEIRTMAQDTLQRLYTAQPNAKSAVEGAAGYAVFSSTVAKLGLAGSGDGEGLAVDNATKNQTFMKMLQLQGGLGFSVEKLRIVFVFDNEKVLNSFVNSGWQWGGQANAAAKTADKVEPKRERHRSQTASGCINSPKRTSTSTPVPEAQSTTRTKP